MLLVVLGYLLVNLGLVITGYLVWLVFRTMRYGYPLDSRLGLTNNHVYINGVPVAFDDLESRL